MCTSSDCKLQLTLWLSVVVVVCISSVLTTLVPLAIGASVLSSVRTIVSSSFFSSWILSRTGGTFGTGLIDVGGDTGLGVGLKSLANGFKPKLRKGLESMNGFVLIFFSSDGVDASLMNAVSSMWLDVLLFAVGTTMDDNDSLLVEVVVKGLKGFCERFATLGLNGVIFCWILPQLSREKCVTVTESSMDGDGLVDVPLTESVSLSPPYTMAWDEAKKKASCVMRLLSTLIYR